MNPLGIIRHYFFATLSFTYSPHHRAHKPLVRLDLSGFIFSNIFRKARMCWEFLEVAEAGFIQAFTVPPPCLEETKPPHLMHLPRLKFRYAVFEHVEPPESANRIFAYR